MFYVSVVQYYFDKTKICLKLLPRGPMWPLAPRFLHAANAANQPLAPDYYFCFLQFGTSANGIDVNKFSDLNICCAGNDKT